MKIYDKDIRRMLLKEFVKKQEFITDPTTVIINELDVCFGSARIDLAVINGKMHGFEIKSERDNLDRLSSQVEFYCKVFDTLTLVISENHWPKVTQLIPEWWGIYCIVKDKNQPNIEAKRAPKQNNNIEALNLTQLLWKEELFELLKSNSVSKGIKSKTRLELGKMVTQRVEKEQIASFVRRKFKTREPWKAVQLQQLYDGLPQS